MSLPKKNLLMRLVASVLCLLALSIYTTFMPTAVLADPPSCTCGGGMDQQCSGGQRCICLSTNGVCSNCVWNDDRFCTPCND
jgi:hypothetical protein